MPGLNVEFSRVKYYSIIQTMKWLTCCSVLFMFHNMNVPVEKSQCSLSLLPRQMFLQDLEIPLFFIPD